MLEIMTERCCLRPMTDADFPALCRYLQDPGVMYAYGHAFSDREVWDWLRRQQARYVVPGYGALAVELRETGEMIGQCGITMQDCAGVTACTAAADGEEGGQAPAGEEEGPSALLSERIDATPRTLQVPEVGYLLAKNYWHRGYATESARACMEFAFDVLGMPEVFSCIRDDNTPSLAVARRNGMELCGRFSKHYYGQDMEHLLYVARKESWGTWMTKSVFGNSFINNETFQQYACHGYLSHGLRHIKASLVIPHKTPPANQPAECSFNYPTLRHWLKACLPWYAFHDFHNKSKIGGLVHQ